LLSAGALEVSRAAIVHFHCSWYLLPDKVKEERHYGFLNPNSALPIEKVRELISFIHDITALFTENPGA
jgi:hypothetical protein